MPLILGHLLCLLEDDADTTLVLYLQETLGALVLLLGQFAEKWPTLSRATSSVVEIAAQREIGVGGPRC